SDLGPGSPSALPERTRRSEVLARRTGGRHDTIATRLLVPGQKPDRISLLSLLRLLASAPARVCNPVRLTGVHTHVVERAEAALELLKRSAIFLLYLLVPKQAFEEIAPIAKLLDRDPQFVAAKPAEILQPLRLVDDLA